MANTSQSQPQADVSVEQERLEPATAQSHQELDHIMATLSDVTYPVNREALFQCFGERAIELESGDSTTVGHLLDKVHEDAFQSREELIEAFHRVLASRAPLGRFKV